MTTVLERPTTSKIPTKGDLNYPNALGEVLHECGDLDGTFWRLEIIADLKIAEINDALNALAGNTERPNPFYSPEILKAAAVHLSPKTVRYLCLWRMDFNKVELVFFLPVTTSKLPWQSRAKLTGWTHDYGPLGTPLLSKHRHQATLRVLGKCLYDTTTDAYEALIICQLEKNAPISKTLAFDPLLAEQTIRYGTFSRASLKPAKVSGIEPLKFSGKRKQRLNHALRKLEEIGQVEYSSVSSEKDIANSLYSHMLIENGSWKGKAGTSMLNDKKVHTFFEVCVERLAAKGSCEFHTLNLDQEPIASLLLVKVDSFFFPWKIASSEEYNEYSVGNLLVTHVNQKILQTEAFKGLDSLASEHNHTANRYWPSQTEFSNLVIGLGPQSSKAALSTAYSHQRISSVKRRMKSLFKNLIGTFTGRRFY